MGRALVVDSRRLFAAADLLLEKIESKEGVNSLIPIRADGQPSTDAPPRMFTQTELVAAMSMLIRMGFADPDEKKT